MEMKVQTIFPTTVVEWDLGRDITEQELAVATLHGTDGKCHRNMGNVVSNERYILRDNQELSLIKEFVETGIRLYVENVLMATKDVEFYITQSWLNYTSPGEFHHRHSHPNSIISGVFYFNADPETDKIHFYNDSQYRQIEYNKSTYNWYNANSWWFPIKTGKMVLFPSSLQHMVEQTESSETRISLAFNVFLKGSLGNEKTLTALYL
jgi:uncharacterized protein (TIGR02466 family)